MSNPAENQGVNKPMVEPIYCNIPEAMRITGLSERKFRSWVEKRLFPFHKVRGRILFKIDDLISLIESSRVEPLDPKKQAKIMIGNMRGFSNNPADSGLTASQNGGRKDV